MKIEDFNITNDEHVILNKFIDIKSQSGTHSPSIFNLQKFIPEIDIKIDACFLSNPYATELYMQYFQDDIISAGKLRDLLEFYPSQNKFISKVLSKNIGIHYSNLFIGNGAIEIIQAILHRFAKGKILINIPTFSSYYEFVRSPNEVIFYNLKKSNKYKLDIINYIDFVNEKKPDSIVLINPNNPTGDYISKIDLLYLVKKLSFVNNIIIDESFIHFASESDDNKLVSLSDLVTSYSNVILIKSMSKDFGIAGVRAGYAVMESSKVSALLENGYLWNSNGLAEHFFNLYSSPKFNDAYEIVRKKYVSETKLFINELKKIKKITVYESSANFILIELPNNISSDLITSILLIRYGIYVRNCDDKIGLIGNYIRMASRSLKENNVIIESFKELFGYEDIV